MLLNSRSQQHLNLRPRVDQSSLLNFAVRIFNFFPLAASCDYWRWGSGGQQENINAICVLTTNMVNDKVFLILWWWFLFLAIVGALRIIYRIIQTL